MALAAIAAGAMAPRPFRVERVDHELDDTVTLTLRPRHEEAPFPFAPGQFNMLYRFGMGEVAISISGDPGRPERLIHTIRAVGTVTHALRRLEPGAVVGVRGPFGSSWPLAAAEGADVVIVAGGIGLAPLRPAILALLAQRGRFGRVLVLYGARTPQDVLFARELERWRARSDATVAVTVDHATGDWRGPVGVVTQLIDRAPFDPGHAVAFVCGPEAMIRFAVQSLNDRGLGDERIFVSLERNMKCAVGFCGHCQFGGQFVCRDGPVFRFDRIRHLFRIREL